MKKALAWFLFLLFLMPTVALAETVRDLELTLEFAFGSRTGVFSGDVQNGLPNGAGSFVTRNDEGDAWTYIGEWVDGHLEGYGTSEWDSGWREEGIYANDRLNGEGAEYNGDILWREGTYVDGALSYGTEYDAGGISYFTGAFTTEGFRVEDAGTRVARLRDFFGEAVEFDYDAVMADPESFAGKRVFFAGTVSYIWEYDYQAYDEFALDVYGDADRWVDVYGYLAQGEKRRAVGDENVVIFGVFVEAYDWQDTNGNWHTSPSVQAIGIEQVDFKCALLKNGSSGAAVKALQGRLADLGYYEKSIDGDFGNGTKTALEAFQLANGLAADGVASIYTLYLLYSAFALPQ